MPRQSSAKVPDYIISRLAKEAVSHAFGITGGANANVLDAFTRTKKIKFIPFQHEQGAAMAAEAYARLHKSALGVVFVTSGPGGANAITGIYGAWFDSIPMLVISGQVGTFDLKGSRKIRQYGFQEADMLATMRPFVKYSALVDDKERLPFHLESAIFEAKSGRPGPAHIDLPIDIQLEKFNYSPRPAPLMKRICNELPDIRKIIRLMVAAERPVFVPGAGIRLSWAMEQFRLLAKKLNWPILPSWAFADCLPEDDKNRIGLFGVYGNKGANFAIQNADLVLAIGTRLDSRMIGSLPGSFARNAVKVVVDIDRGELEKNDTADIAVHFDAGAFMHLLRTNLPEMPRLGKWKKKCLEWKTAYPNVTKEHYSGRMLSPYAVVREISNSAKEGDIIIPDCGGNLTWTMQGWEFKKDQRLFSAFGNSPMGYSLPASIGAYFATGKSPICIIGDGGIQMNIQELQTIKNYKVPIRIFVFNNQGYGIIRQFQDDYIGGRHFASAEGVPDFAKIAKAYGIRAMRISKKNFPEIKKAMRAGGAILCEVMLDPKAKLLPKTRFRRPIEESDPPLPEKELLENLLIERWEEK